MDSGSRMSHDGRTLLEYVTVEFLRVLIPFDGIKLRLPVEDGERAVHLHVGPVQGQTRDLDARQPDAGTRGYQPDNTCMMAN